MPDLYSRLKDRLQQHITSAEAIAAKADSEGRIFSSGEDIQMQQHMDDMRRLTDDMKTAKADAKVRAQLSALGGDVPELDRGIYGNNPAIYGGGSSGYKVGGSAWSQRVARQVAGAATSFGVKSITLGSWGIPAPVEPTVTLPDLPHRLLDLIPVRALESNEYSYPKQVTRAPNVLTVADGDTKPESIYTFTEVIDRARYVAHLTEAIPIRYFSDHQDLEGILDQQMRQDMLVKIEGLIAAGTGVGEDWLGILGTSGVLAQAYSGDLVTTIRKSRTLLAVRGVEPTALCFNPEDIETLDLLKDLEGRYYGQDLGPLLGNLPRIPSSAIPVGTGVLGDFRQSRLFIREDATLDVDRSGPDLFDKNLAKIRCEMRAGFGVLQPGAFVSIDLTA